MFVIAYFVFIISIEHINLSVLNQMVQEKLKKKNYLALPKPFDFGKSFYHHSKSVRSR
jgi:hypothetical protein